MKKILTAVLAGSLALGAVSCKKDTANTPKDKENGTTTTSMRMIVTESPLKAAPSQTDVAGVGGETKVSKGLFITFSEVVNNLTQLSFNAGTSPTEKVWISNPFEYAGQTGTKMSGFILSPYTNPAIETGDLAKETTIDLTATPLKDIAKTDGFTMSSKTKEITILPGVTEAEVSAQTSPKNNFSYNVERLVAKAQVVRTSENMPTLDPKVSDLGSFDTNASYRFSVAGAAKKLYLFGDFAGERTMSNDATKNVDTYKGYTSAIHDLPATTFTVDPATGLHTITLARDLTKVSEKSLVAPLATETTDFANKSSLKAHVGQVKESNTEGIYFFENSLDKNVTKVGELNFNDITYVKIYAKFTFNPTKLQKVEGGKLVEATGDDLTKEHTYKVVVDEATKTKLIKNGIEEAKFTPKSGSDKFDYEMTDKAGTFYKGENNKYYLTLEASRLAGNVRSEKFDGGVMLWMTPANNQMDATQTFTKYADTRRNNIYSMSLDKISGLGGNYDPIDPDDPNAPKPKDNPDEPEKDPVVPVDPAKTYIKLTANVLNWNVVDRSLDLK